MNVLAVGAHFDDVELGCGGTLRKLYDQGNNIFIYVATKSGFVSVLDRHTIRDNAQADDEGKRSAQLLGGKLICGEYNTFCLDYASKINTEITRIVETYQIDMVFNHWDKDCHHDHWSLSKAVFHGAKHVKRILEYRSSWYEAETQFIPNFYVDISEYMDFKLQLLKCFESEYTRVGEQWDLFVQSDAALNGLKNDCKYAEGFQCIRWLL